MVEQHVKCKGCPEIIKINKNKKFCSAKCRYVFHYEYKIIEFECLNCLKKFKASDKSRRKFCSKICRVEHSKKLYNKNNPLINLPTAVIGSISELKVCADLLSKGYEIFRSLSPSCSCDLAMLCNKKLYRIEVTTAHRTALGKIYHTKGKSLHKFDILALVVKNDEIVYEPDLPKL